VKCAEFHRQYNRHANGEVQVGELPPWMHVQGRRVRFDYRFPRRPAFFALRFAAFFGAGARGFGMFS